MAEASAIMKASHHLRLSLGLLALGFSAFALFVSSTAQDISGGSSSELASAADVESRSGRGVFTAPKTVAHHSRARLENKTVARAGNTSRTVRETTGGTRPDTSGSGDQNDNRSLGSTKPLGGAARRVAGPDELNQQADAAFDAGQYDKAVDLYLKAIKQRPKFPEAYQSLSEAYFNLGKFNEAVEAAKQAISQKPDFADAYVALGNAYLKLD